MTSWPAAACLGLVLAQASGALACDPSPSPPPSPTPASEVFTAADGTRFSVEVVLTNLEIPWSLVFAPDGRLFFTERPGRVRVYENGSLRPEPALVLDDVAATGEAGALGMTLHPRFAENRLVYLAYTARRAGGGMINRLVRYREVNNTLAERVVLLDDMPGASIHDGARVKFGPDGKLYLTMGDAAVANNAQDLSSRSGKIFRLNDDGSTPGDNPLPSIVYSYGHRNPQGIDWHPRSGDLWESEHGATGNDEINRIEPGGNHGWPVIEGGATRAGMVSPVIFFTPAIAPSGAAFYTGSLIPGFRDNLFVAALRGQQLRRVRLDPADPRRVLDHEALLQGRYGRLRDVVTGPDGFLYFSTSNRDGRGSADPADDRILRIVPAR